MIDITDMTKGMNKSQITTFRQFLEFHLHDGRYEVKRFRTEMVGRNNKDVFVSITFGLPNDEGKWSELLCRDTYIFFVGERGGIYTYSTGDRDYRKCRQKYNTIKSI